MVFSAKILHCMAMLGWGLPLMIHINYFSRNYNPHPYTLAVTSENNF